MLTTIKTYFTDLIAKIKADITNTLTLIGTIFGSILAHIDALAAALGDPNLNQQMTTVLGDAKLAGKWLLGVSIVSAIANFKKLIQTPKA